MTLAEFVNTIDVNSAVTIAVCVDDNIYSPECDNIQTITTTIFAFIPSVLDTEEYLSEKFCNAKIVSIKFIEEKTIQIWLDNADEYSLCD
mgnify:FL=1